MGTPIEALRVPGNFPEGRLHRECVPSRSFWKAVGPCRSLLRGDRAGDPGAVARLRELCAEEGVPHTFWCS